VPDANQMEYWPSVFNRAVRETAWFTTNKLLVGFVIAVVLRIGEWRFGKPVLLTEIIHSLLIVAGSYGIVILASFLWKLSRIPVATNSEKEKLLVSKDQAIDELRRTLSEKNPHDREKDKQLREWIMPQFQPDELAVIKQVLITGRASLSTLHTAGFPESVIGSARSKALKNSIFHIVNGATMDMWEINPNFEDALKEYFYSMPISPSASRT
jgi:hypothetical protein